MQRKSVQSSNLKSIGYKNQTLEIEFNKGDVYQYFGIPETEYTALMSAKSHGKYFSSNIRNRYEYDKII